MLRISLDAQIEELEQHFETAHLNYLQQTAQRTHDFKELTQNDQRLSREIEMKKKKIDNLQVPSSLPPLSHPAISHLSPFSLYTSLSLLPCSLLTSYGMECRIFADNNSAVESKNSSVES
jgi:hypothetical protein